MNYGITWVKLEKYADLTGDTVDAVMSRRKAGKWIEGEQCKIVDGRLWINLRAVEDWIESRGDKGVNARQVSSKRVVKP